MRTVVGLGAFPAPTPHTRPVRLASTVPPQSADLAGRVGSVHGTLEVPAGVQAALEVALGDAGVPVIGLWARVPHYVSAMPYPEASAALIEGLCAVTGVGARRLLGPCRRRGVTAPGRRADRIEPRAPRHGPAAGDRPRLRGDQSHWASTGRSPAGTRSPPSSSSSSRTKGTDGPDHRPGGGAEARAGGCGPGARRRRRRTPCASTRTTTTTASINHGLDRRAGPSVRQGPAATATRRRGTAPTGAWPTGPPWPAGHRADQDGQLGHQLAHLIDGGGRGQLAQPDLVLRGVSSPRSAARSNSSP